ncbi:hypothetical protein QOT17_002260 [Balamuthia mandrillaris]
MDLLSDAYGSFSDSESEEETEGTGGDGTQARDTKQANVSPKATKRGREEVEETNSKKPTKTGAMSSRPTKKPKDLPHQTTKLHPVSFAAAAPSSSSFRPSPTTSTPPKLPPVGFARPSPSSSPHPSTSASSSPSSLLPPQLRLRRANLPTEDNIDYDTVKKRATHQPKRNH